MWGNPCPIPAVWAKHYRGMGQPLAQSLARHSSASPSSRSNPAHPYLPSSHYAFLHLPQLSGTICSAEHLFCVANLRTTISRPSTGPIPAFSYPLFWPYSFLPFPIPFLSGPVFPRPISWFPSGAAMQSFPSSFLFRDNCTPTKFLMSSAALGAL